MKPRDAHNNLIVANFTFPGEKWKVDREGRVTDGGLSPKYFDLATGRDQTYALIALRHHGWDVKQVKRNSKTEWLAFHDKTGQWQERPTLGPLLVDLIERVKGA